jgi:hypothetical protein
MTNSLAAAKERREHKEADKKAAILGFFFEFFVFFRG